MGFAAKLAIAAFLLAPAAANAEPWSRSYVVDWLEPAFFYGGPENDFIAPGTDCPAGTAVSPPLKTQLLTPKWRGEDAIPYYLDAENHPDLLRILRFRGPNYEDVWENPTLAPDLGGLPPVSGNTGYGFNLDGKLKPTDFTSPEGEKGIDNNYYRATGCWVSYRAAPYQGERPLSNNGHMRDGMYTIVLVVSGNKDPMNDDDATLGIYESKDRIEKDANGQVAQDASFSIKPTTRTQSLLKVKIRNGVVETSSPQEIRIRDEAWNMSSPSQIQLTGGQLRLKLKEDGGFEGYFGGYREWKILYRRQAVTARDTETLRGIDLPSFYYQLERFADADPDPATGNNRRISVAYRLRGVPAYVLSPDYAETIKVARAFADAPPTKVAGSGGQAGE